MNGLQTRHLAWNLLFGAALVAAACSGDDGAPGAAGAPGTPGAVGQTGAAGPPASADGGGATNADAGVFIVRLSERSQRGLTISPVPLALQGKTAAQIEEIGLGSYLVNAAADCSSCHSPAPNKYLAGGVVFPLDATNFVVSRNLTPDPTTGLKDTEAQFIQAERTGTDILNTGKALIFHPWLHERWLGTSDLKAIYAFLRAVPPINNTYAADVKPTLPALAFSGTYDEGDVPRTLPPEVDPMGQPIPDPEFVLRGLAIVPLDIAPPSDASTLALYGRGSYLVNSLGSCSGCHTNPPRKQNATQSITTTGYLTGGLVIPAGPAAPIVKVQRSMSANLVGATKGFFNKPGVTFQTFLRTIVEGVHADEILDGGGSPPLAYPMPYATFRNMTLRDLEALYTYLHHVATTAALADKDTLPAARYCTGNTECTGAGETCDTTAHECIGRDCTSPANCDVCQKCDGSNKCAAYTAGEAAALGACIVTGL